MFVGNETASDDVELAAEEMEVEEDNSYYLKEHLSDVTILVGEEKLHAHRAILANRSKIFAAWFMENPDKKEMPVLSTSPEACRLLLKYIYTGNTCSCDVFNFPLDDELILELLNLAYQYSVKELSSIIVSKIDMILDTKNVIFFLNGANDHDFDELRDACHLLIDDNPLEILSCDTFNFLTQKSLIQILKRDTFSAPEIEIFKSVAKWCERNNSSDSSVLECIRFSALNVSEITSIVWPTKLVDSDKLLEIMSGLADASENLVDVAVSSVNPNAATLDCVICTSNLSGYRNVRQNYCVYEKHSIVFRLSRPLVINHICMEFSELDHRCHSYYVETSLDQNEWHKIIDYSAFPCRFVQNLYFHQQTAQYIKIVGTGASEGNDFRLVFFEALYKKEIPKVIHGVIQPEKNVATPENGARVIQGECSDNLLNGNHKCSAYHTVGDLKPIIVQLAQPYTISSMKLLLLDRFKYKYFIETSVNGRDWKIVVDRTDVECTSWQDLDFAKRVVVFIQITGTYSSSPSKKFKCLHFECASLPNPTVDFSSILTSQPDTSKKRKK